MHRMKLATWIAAVAAAGATNGAITAAVIAAGALVANGVITVLLSNYLQGRHDEERRHSDGETPRPREQSDRRNRSDRARDRHH